MRGALISRNVLAGIFIVSIVVLFLGLIIFLRMILIKKERRVFKLAIALSGLCVVLTGLEVYMYCTTEGYLRILICIPMIIYGIALIWLARWYKRPTVTISPKYAVDADRAKEDYNLQELSLERRGGTLENHLDIILKPDRYNVKIIPVTVTRLNPEDGSEITVNKNVNKRCVLAVEDILRKHKVSSWKKLPGVEGMAIDAATATIKVEYQNHDQIYFSNTRCLPAGEEVIFDEIEECILEYAALKKA